MLSDLRVLDAPLDKHACASCGFVMRASRLQTRLFESGYLLYGHAPGGARESARQTLYAQWLSAYVTGAPQSILDIGCGNGSLLLALQRQWPRASLRGLDPSPESVRCARDAGIDARCGRVGEVQLAPADLVISVNVIEHVEDPLVFLQAVATLLSPGGSLLVACPDGGRPWLELLFADHLWSFSAAHLTQLASCVGLNVTGCVFAPAALGAFQLIRLSRDAPLVPVSIPSAETEVVINAKARYLRAWGTLEQDLIARAGAAESLACFGAGEAAALLRAYAPAVWRRVTMCLVDGPEETTFGDVPVVNCGHGGVRSPVLLGIRPEGQPGVAQRLLDAGCSVIRWDDRIAV
jgi:SAM-dependent methyltransferase